MKEKVLHTIPPFWDENSEILILGSFPSVKSRETAFFYGHPQNRFWRVLATVYGNELPQTVEEKQTLLRSNRVALWDVIYSCSIEGSADSSISDAVPNDVAMILNSSKIRKIYVNGKTAERLYKKLLEATLKRTAAVLPSTSPANASCNIEKLVSVWKQIKD